MLISLGSVADNTRWKSVINDIFIGTQFDSHAFLQAKGKGYAMNTAEELKFVKEVANSTGVILDPVYRYARLSNSFLFLVIIES